MKTRVLWMAAAAALAAGLPACDQVVPGQDGLESLSSVLVTDGKMDPMLRVLVGRGITPATVHRAFPAGLARARLGVLDGREVVVVDVLMEATPDALPRLAALGVQVRTVTDSGIVTATVPVERLQAVSALDEVGRVELAKRVHLYNDLSNGLATTASGTYAGMNNARSLQGEGVVVGVLDTGLDWTHKDFILDATESTATPTTRIAYYWDQSDTADGKPPSDLGFAYGHEYVAADFNDGLRNHDNTWDPATNRFGPMVDATYPILPAAFDTDGHGTHVTGTSAGDGSGSGMMGVAPKADIIFVKFDFDGDRNTDAAIVDGVNYIFKRAAAMGKPAVINMSLGSDYGPHDGNTLEERGLNDLAGPGKMVVVAAGNPGAANWSPNLRWGYALHGSAALNTEAITFRFPTYTAGTDNYMFLDIFYKTGNKCRVQVTTPGGTTYPPSTAKTTWVTGSAYSGYNTAEGGILVGNGGDELGWGMVNGDQEAYVEISDYYGKLPAVGTWTIKLVKADTKSTCSGTFHAWYGASDNVMIGWRNEPTRNPTPRFGGRESDNKVTIGTPATANEIIAVGAYQTRESWSYAYGDECLPVASSTQDYRSYPISYYDPMAAGELATFSARGPRRDGVLKPEIAAPGVGIASAFSHFVRQAEWPNRCVDYWTGGPYHFGTNRVLPNLEATVIQGTSMATPNATGATALFLQRKPDLADACLRKVMSTASRHDTATDTYRNVANSEFTDTDTAAGAGKSNNDWGYGKLDIDATLAALAAYPSCTTACKVATDCGTGKTCKAATDPCACNTCVASCYSTGTTCTSNSQCCSGTCAKSGSKKVCR